MKWQKRWARHMNEDENRSQGSIVIEAALVMPIVIIVLLLFIVLIRLCTLQMALHGAVTQTVKQAAAHIYPAQLAWQELKQHSADDEKEDSESGNRSVKLLPWSESAAKAAEWLPAPADLLVSSALKGDWRPFQNMAATELGRAVVEPLLHGLADEYAIDSEKIRLHALILPDLNKKEEPYLTIAAEYEFPLKLPFTGRSLVLLEQATERVWISDSLPAMYGSEAEQEERVPLQILSIEPTPVRPGRKATVTAQTSPGAVLSLDVMYKSGTSKAKNLGEATADEEGRVVWTWHVSGNTTPGVWLLTASVAGEAEHAVSKHFSVEKARKESDG